jgi:hypothetical protein
MDDKCARSDNVNEDIQVESTVSGASVLGLADEDVCVSEVGETSLSARVGSAELSAEMVSNIDGSTKGSVSIE